MTRESGLDYFFARYYNPLLGRFMSPDPANIGAVADNPQSWNAYAYVLNNPETLTDPFGTAPCSWQDTNGCSEEDLATLAGIGGAGCMENGVVTGCGIAFAGVHDLFDLLEVPIVATQYGMVPSFISRGPSFGYQYEGRPGLATSWLLGPARIAQTRTYLGNMFDLPGALGSLAYSAETLRLQAEDVAQGAVQNLFSEFKNGGCVADFGYRVAKLPKYPRVGPLPQDTVRAGGAAWAFSSAARGGSAAGVDSILGGAATAASYVAALPLDLVALNSFIGEMKDLSSGACH